MSEEKAQACQEKQKLSDDEKNKYYCRTCGTEITNARVLFRAHLCNECWDEMIRRGN